ncbi:class I SAM-dependent methyltransferase [Paraburkholderia fungorum]|uniref:class I SAM-dependent methyltransferase n=1 Tax=Paraburkholderia fungorum TaxID=134537 RepID=UPI0038BC7246
MSNNLFDHVVAKLGKEDSTACKICGGAAQPFDFVDFNKTCDKSLYPSGLRGIPVLYRKCTDCGFIFTDFFDDFTPDQWRTHVYNDDYAKVDPDYDSKRPRSNVIKINVLLIGRKKKIIGLDYGGGNGKTSALLRAQGWAFDSYDPFGHTDMSPERLGRYNFCSAMEVFEHSPNPVSSLQDIVGKMASGRAMIVIGTGIHDGIVSAQTRLSWWYAAPRNGHISLFSRRSIEILASRFGLSYASIYPGTHLLTRDIGKRETLAMRSRLNLVWRVRHPLGSDQ